MQAIAELIDLVRTRYAVVFFWIPLVTLFICNPGKNFANLPDFSLMKLYAFGQASALLIPFGLTGAFSPRFYDAVIHKDREGTWRVYALWIFSLTIGFLGLWAVASQVLARISVVGAVGFLLLLILVSALLLRIFVLGFGRKGN